MGKAILTLNAGSSSVKFSLFTFDEKLELLADGRVTGIESAPVFEIRKLRTGEKNKHDMPVSATHTDALDAIWSWLTSHKDPDWEFARVAHRIVHGGKRYSAPTLLTREAIAYLESIYPLAPLHQPHNVGCIKIIAEKQPHILQYGCFDTAFHAKHDRVFSSFALPAKMREQGIQRYGFHGLSYQWIAHCLQNDYPHLASKRVVVAHLGNGASLCAMKNSKSVDTTMGMSTLDGLPMGTRCGNIDPGALLYMLNTLKMSPDQIEHVLYHESGLKGLSGISNDVKVLSENNSDDACFALAYFATRTAQAVASMAVAVGGMDALIFTGGIGENAKGLRHTIVDQLSFLPAFETHVIPADEERGMAREIYTHFKMEVAA